MKNPTNSMANKKENKKRLKVLVGSIAEHSRKMPINLIFVTDQTSSGEIINVMDNMSDDLNRARISYSLYDFRQIVDKFATSMNAIYPYTNKDFISVILPLFQNDR